MNYAKVNYAGMTHAQMDRAIKAERALFEATTKSGDYYIADLREIFDRAYEGEEHNWKMANKINVTGWDKDHREMLLEAIVFYHGRPGKVITTGGKVFIQAQGYAC